MLICCVKCDVSLQTSVRVPILSGTTPETGAIIVMNHSWWQEPRHSGSDLALLLGQLFCWRNSWCYSGLIKMNMLSFLFPFIPQRTCEFIAFPSQNYLTQRKLVMYVNSYLCRCSLHLWEANHCGAILKERLRMGTMPKCVHSGWGWVFSWNVMQVTAARLGMGLQNILSGCNNWGLCLKICSS